MLQTAQEKKTSLNTLLSVMDIAGELRLQREKAEKILDVEGEREQIKSKIRSSAEISGENLTEQEIDRALDAYYQGLYRFEPAAAGISSWLAKVYINRGKFALFFALPFLFFASVFLGLKGANSFMSSFAEERVSNLYTEATAALGDISKLALEPEAISRGQTLLTEIEALRDEPGKGDEITELHKEMLAIRDLLRKRFDIKVLNSPGKKSGIDRYFTGELGQEKLSAYYIIVQALDNSGEVIERTIVNREDGKPYKVKVWGEEVPKAVYEAVARDKQDNGIIDNNLFARKTKGFLEAKILMKAPGGRPLVQRSQITEWE